MLIQPIFAQWDVCQCLTTLNAIYCILWHTEQKQAKLLYIHSHSSQVTPPVPCRLGLLSTIKGDSPVRLKRWMVSGPAVVMKGKIKNTIDSYTHLSAHRTGKEWLIFVGEKLTGFICLTSERCPWCHVISPHHSVTSPGRQQAECVSASHVVDSSHSYPCTHTHTHITDVKWLASKWYASSVQTVTSLAL